MSMTKSKQELSSAIYTGHVMHRRNGNIRHRFVYRVFACCFDLDELPVLSRRTTVFSYNRWNLLSFNDRDHGPCDGSVLRPWVESQLVAAGIMQRPERIRLVCFPRLLGYVFNPLSVWFCDDETGSPFAILYEVRNTFGGRYCYVLPVAGETSVRPIVQRCRKRLYVSPFFPIAGEYRFRIRSPDDRLSLAIHYRSEKGGELLATQSGRRGPFTNVALIKAIATHPLMTLKVIAAIHWQALRLFLKGARIQPGLRGTGNSTPGIPAPGSNASSSS
jgi:uncharacterized protein